MDVTALAERVVWEIRGKPMLGRVSDKFDLLQMIPSPERLVYLARESNTVVGEWQENSNKNE